MRIISGSRKGHTIHAPLGRSTRPTSDRVRENLFNIVGPVDGASVLDLYAGSGALGLEALSRGAASADFVETRPSSLHALKANIVLLRARDKTRVYKKDALPFAAELRDGSYDIAFVDPPYGSRMLDRVIEGWQRSHFSPILVAEHEATHALPAGAELMRFGETSVSIYGMGTAR